MALRQLSASASWTGGGDATNQEAVNRHTAILLDSHGDSVAAEQVDEATQVLLAGDSAERRVGVLSTVAGSVTT